MSPKDPHTPATNRPTTFENKVKCRLDISRQLGDASSPDSLDLRSWPVNAIERLEDLQRCGDETGVAEAEKDLETLPNQTEAERLTTGGSSRRSRAAGKQHEEAEDPLAPSRWQNTIKMPPEDLDDPFRGCVSELHARLKERQDAIYQGPDELRSNLAEAQSRYKQYMGCGELFKALEPGKEIEILTRQLNLVLSRHRQLDEIRCGETGGMLPNAIRQALNVTRPKATYPDGPIIALSLGAGGGDRTVRQLGMLAELMKNLSTKLKYNFSADKNVLKPCGVFHLIVGTGTGGLVAIMLGCPRMSVAEVTEFYEGFNEQVYGPLMALEDVTTNVAPGNTDEEAETIRARQMEARNRATKNLEEVSR